MSSDIRKKLERVFVKIDKLAIYGKEKTQDYYLLIDDFVNKGTYQDFELCLFYYYFIDISGIKSTDEVKKTTWSEILLQTQSPFLKKLSKLYKSKNVYQQSFDIYSTDASTVQLTLSSPLSSTYSAIATASTINFTRQNDLIKLNILDSNTNRATIYKSDWEIVNGIEIPTGLELLQRFEVSASFSQYSTTIPTTHNETYLIITQKRGATGSSFYEFNYKLTLQKNTFLGQIKEIESIDTTNYYLKDVNLQKKNKNVITSLQVDKLGSTSSVILADYNPDLTYDNNLLNNYTQALNILLS